MSKKDSIKEDIATLRTFSILFLTSIFGVLGYAITNFDKLTNLKLIVGFVSLFLPNPAVKPLALAMGI